MSSKRLGLALALAFGLGAGAAHGGPKDTVDLDVHIATKGDEVAFDKAKVEVPKGKKIRLHFVNDASKGSEILHNIAVLKPGSLEAVLKDLQTSGYNVDTMRKHASVIAMTKTLAPGESDSLEVTLKDAGDYPYVCFMAGHADMLGMRGVLTVK